MEKKKYIKYSKKLKISDLATLLEVDINDLLNNTDFLDFNIDLGKKINFKQANEIANIYNIKLYRDKGYLFLIGVYIVTFILLAGTATYSVFNYINSNNKNNKNNTDVETGIMNISLIEDSNSALKLLDSYPMSDDKALNLKPFLFTVDNSGTMDVSYRLRLVDYSNDYQKEYKDYQKLDYANIKYSINCLNDSSLNKKGLLKDLVKYDKNNEIDFDNSFIVVDSILKVKKNIKIELRIWIDSEANNDAANKYYVGKIILESDKRK